MNLKCVCVERKCPATNDSTALAHWYEAPAGDMFILGLCYPNTSGQPRRRCFYNGTWSEVTNPCSTIPCAALTNDQHANWPKPEAVNTVVNGTCVGGYSSTGTPSRLCMNDGKWDTTITNPCTPIFCTKTTPSYLPFNADWPETLQAGYSTSGTCSAGYTGTTTRSCSLAGQWNTPSPLCSQIVCPSIPDDGAHASWSSTAAGNTALGTCLDGFEGTPQRECSITGQWGPISNACSRTKHCLLILVLTLVRSALLPREHIWRGNMGRYTRWQRGKRHMPRRHDWISVAPVHDVRNMERHRCESVPDQVRQLPDGEH